jgi:hypothetical protein
VRCKRVGADHEKAHVGGVERCQQIVEIKDHVLAA